MTTFDEFYRSLPEDSNKRGEYFEKVFIPWFLKTDPVWSSKVNQVWLWDDYPQRWGKDCGIDLVYEDNQGKHWAIQSKCISPDREITKAEIDSFLSESSDSRIHGRLLIASTDGIGKNAQQVIDRQEKQVVCFLLEQFRQSEVDFPSSPEDLSTGQRKEKRTPRPHQLEAITNVVEGLQKEDRGQLLMACGTGKTLTSLWIKEALKVKRTLVLLPSLSLLSQTLREWTATSQEKFNWICVCSDKSVAKQDKTTDSMIENVSALGVPVTSDPDEIKRFLLESDGGIVFSTYQSSPLVEESQRSPEVPEFDIAFADEAHRCAGKVSSAFGSILDDQKIRSKKRLFMTATPRVLSKQIKKKADEENINLACMDDISQFGEVFHQLNFSEAIEKELLSDYQVVIIGVDDPSVQAKILDRMLVDTGNECNIDTETLANHIALAKAIKDYDLSRMITFHSRVKSAKKFSEDHPLILDWIPEGSKSPKSAMTSYVSGEMNAKTRNSEINKLRNISEQEVGILANARCLSEGVDVPTLDGIAFFDPRSSQVDIIQAVGRAIRKSENKTDGYIILPVYLGDTTNVEDEILQSRFKDIWSIILALKSQDDSMRDELDQLRVELGRRNAPTESVKGFSKIAFDLPSSISTNFVDSLTTILVRETTENWMEMYGQLIEYKMLFGDANVPNKYPENPSLGVWASNQRQRYKNSESRKYSKIGVLSSEQIDLLDKIGFAWDVIESQWHRSYIELKSFVESYGCYPSREDYPGLCSWISKQRQEYKRLNHGVLTGKKISLLNTIDFTWNAAESAWNAKFQDLINYKNKNGNLSVPCVSEYISLYRWCSRQRIIYREKDHGSLTEDQIKRLEGIGFLWEPLDDAWQQNFDNLVDYLEKYGDINVPKSSSVLYRWTVNQRAIYRRKNNASKSSLSSLQISMLDRIGFVWDMNAYDWENRINEFKSYISETGSTYILDKYDKNPSLGAWASKLRLQYRQHNHGNLSKEKILQLNDLGFVWDKEEFIWQENCNNLAHYVSINGDANVPSRYPENPRLGNWVRDQRGQYNKPNHGLLTADKIKDLIDLDFIFDVNEFVWQQKYKELVQYVEDVGGFTFSDDSDLSFWVSRVRSNRSSLTEKQVDLLNQIGFVWDLREFNWQNRYCELVEYFKVHGHSCVPDKYRENRSLASWVYQQRKHYKKDDHGSLTTEKIDLLNAINFKW